MIKRFNGRKQEKQQVDQENEEIKEQTIEVFYKDRTIYEFTINPSDEHQYEGDPLRVSRFVSTSNLIKDYLGDYTYYYLIPEISETRNSNPYSPHFPRIHYHGIILLKDVEMFLLDSVTKLRKLGSIQINNFRPAYWTKYIKKQRLYVKRIPVIRNCSYKDIQAKAGGCDRNDHEGGKTSPIDCV